MKTILVATAALAFLLTLPVHAAPLKGAKGTKPAKPAASASATPLAPSLSRLDPHGERGADLTKIAPGSKTECNVCHVGASDWKNLKADVAGVCSSCHGKTPHSGVAEHLGKEYRLTASGPSGKMDCMSCHSPHRADAIETRPAGTSILSTERKGLDPETMIQKRAQFPMLRRNCQECHPWK